MLFQHYLFYIFSLLFFVVDIFCYSFFEKQIFYFLLCFFILYIYEEEKQLDKLIIVCLLISLESSLNYGQFGSQLLCLIPISLIAYFAQKLLYATSIQPYLTLISCIFAQSFLIEPLFLMISSPISYTNSKIIANIIVLLCMSLIVSSQGKLGNRFETVSVLKRKVRTPNE